MNQIKTQKLEILDCAYGNWAFHDKRIRQF